MVTAAPSGTVTSRTGWLSGAGFPLAAGWLAADLVSAAALLAARTADGRLAGGGLGETGAWTVSAGAGAV